MAPYFAVGTARFPEPAPEAQLITDAVGWLLARRNSDGTWGTGEGLDRFISTTHVSMTLLAVGFSPASTALGPALRYLVNLDTEQQVSFFWRSGALLNIPDFADVVAHDMEYIWSNTGRIGAHRDYPIPVFLLKLMRFCESKLDLSFNEEDVVRWIINEWDHERCWYGRTSITSMALALLYDTPFKDRDRVIERSREFLDEEFDDHGDGTGAFSGHLVDDCFTVYNLCERPLLVQNESGRLAEQVAAVAAEITSQVIDGSHWVSPPPFGGEVGDEIYPTAVATRALMSVWLTDRPLLLQEVAAGLLDIEVEKLISRPEPPTQPFWGQADGKEEGACFVLMPYAPQNLTVIYQRYVKAVIEECTDLRCLRADDIYQPTTMMGDIWLWINRSKLVIADLTGRNPNVLYELGLAHAVGKLVILIAQSIKDIPTDLRPVRTIIYDDSLEGYDVLSSQLRRYIGELGLAKGS